MKVGISQPEHFPYMGYFQKMAQSDLFIILDHVEYGGRGSFQNRNRFMNKQNILEWFTVPLSSSSHKTPINELTTGNAPNWRRKIVRKLQCNFGLNLDSIYESDRLIDINLAGIDYLRKRLKINTPIVLSSSLKSRSRKSHLIADLCKEVGASTYLSGLGGKEYLDESAFSELSVEFMELKVPDYMTSLSHVL